MAQKTRHKKQSARSGTLVRVEPNRERGFDFGVAMKVMAVTDIDFNQALRDAGVFACAHGFEPLEGKNGAIPSIALVGQDRSGFVRAFESFARWGCEEDGDVVDVHMMLKRDGTYQMWITPEINRSMYRTIRQSDLFQPLALLVSWVKSFDTTHPMVRDLKSYCDRAFSPVVVTAGLGDPRDPRNPRFEPIADLPRLLKFDLRIVREEDEPNDPRFKFGSGPKKSLGPPRDRSEPEDYRRQREKIFDIVFPISRERVRRSGLLHQVRQLRGFEDICEAQIVQGAINLILSSELTEGDRHYSKIDRDLSKRVWEHLASRHELADSKGPPAFEPLLVAHQIDLDVRSLLSLHGVPVERQTFPKLQAFFRRKGFACD